MTTEAKAGEVVKGGVAFTDAIVRNVVAWAPTVAAVFGVLLAGAVFSRVAERTARWLTERLGVTALVERLGFGSLLERLGERTLPEVLGRLVNYLGWLITVYVLAEVVQIKALGVLIAYVVAMLPKVAAAGGVMGAGLVVAGLARGVVDRLARRRQELDAPGALSSAVYYLVLVLAGALAAEQLGFEVRLVRRLIVITVGAATLGGALTVALAGRGALTQIIAGVHVRRQLEKGDLILFEGEPVELAFFGPVSVWLEGERGRIVCPYAQLTREPLVRLSSRRSGGERVERGDELHGGAEAADPVAG